MFKVTVITVCFNAIKTIEAAMRSVIDQGDIVTEYIIMDGGSNDGTVDIVNQYSSKNEFIKLVSEKDKGVYDAINKGVRLATGDWISLLHADDVYSSSKVIKQAISKSKPEHNLIYGNLRMLKNGLPFREWRSEQFNLRLLKQAWMPPHPTLIAKRELLNLVGEYLLDYKISSDFEYCQRLFRFEKTRALFTDEYIIDMSIGGLSTGGFKSEYIKFREDWKIMRLYNINPFFGMFRKKIFKLNQFKIGPRIGIRRNRFALR